MKACTPLLLAVCLAGSFTIAASADGIDEVGNFNFQFNVFNVPQADRGEPLPGTIFPSLAPGFESPADVDALVCAALERGGHVRVGIGDNPIAAAGRRNRELVEHVVALAAKIGRAPASPRDVLHTVGLA